MTARKKPDDQAAEIREEQPTHGGSYVRREDGSLEQVEGAVDPKADPEPVVDTPFETDPATDPVTTEPQE